MAQLRVRPERGKRLGSAAYPDAISQVPRFEYELPCGHRAAYFYLLKDSDDLVFCAHEKCQRTYPAPTCVMKPPMRGRRSATDMDIAWLLDHAIVRNRVAFMIVKDALTDEEIAACCACSVRTVRRVRQSIGEAA